MEKKVQLKGGLAALALAGIVSGLCATPVHANVRAITTLGTGAELRSTLINREDPGTPQPTPGSDDKSDEGKCGEGKCGE